MDGFIKILYILLLVVFFKIVHGLLKMVEGRIKNQIRKNKLRYGIVISRKDLASANGEVRVRNRFLYRLAHNNLYPMIFIPYDRIYDDRKAVEQDDFLYWCGQFLSDEGFTDIEYTCNKEDKCNDILCYKDREPVYVQCRLLGNIIKDSAVQEDHWESMGRPDLQKFVGTMIHDDIHQGIVLTTGDFTGEAMAYAGSLPERIAVDLIDGKELTKKVRVLRGKAYYNLEKG
jgi:hypothetical protein